MNELLGIAKSQKGLIWCILANLICLLAAPVLMYAVAPFQIYFTYRLATLLNLKLPILWVLGMLVPLLSLILLLILSNKATKRLKAEGVAVGLMGARMSDIETKVSSQPMTPAHESVQ